MPSAFRLPPKPANLARSGDFAALLDAAGHQSPRVRKRALTCLAELGQDEALPEITAGLSHPSDAVRCAAIRTLCGWGQAEPIAVAVAWLPSRGASRSLAFAAIAQLDRPETAPLLAHSLVHGTAQEGLWEDEVEVVGRVSGADDDVDARREVIDILIAALGDQDVDVVGRAEDFLLWLGEAAAPALIGLARTADSPDRAVWLLGQIGGASVLEPLIEATEHPEARTREEACAALGELRDPASVEALLRATRDGEHGVRVKAGTALENIGTAAFLAGVSTLLQPQLDQSPGVQVVDKPKAPPRLARPAPNGTPANGSAGHAPAARPASGAHSARHP